MRARLLLASVHDVGPLFESEVDQLFDRISRSLGSARMAMLVVPNHWGKAPLSAAPAFQNRLRGWAEAGVEMFVHGWFHKDTTRHSGLAAWKGAHMTAGEGEFLGLDAATAAQRISDGRALIEDIIGRPAAGFVAPAWLYGKGAHAALATSGLPIAEDHLRVWHPASGKVLARGPVVTWATRSRARTASSLAFAALARQALKPFPVVRIAVHPGDVHSTPVLQSIDRTLATLSRERTPASYAQLLDGLTPSPPCLPASPLPCPQN